MPEIVEDEIHGLQNPNDVLDEQSEWLRVTLLSIGDAVIAIDPLGRILFLNPVAEALTGWISQEAKGVLLDQVFRIINESTRRTIESPAVRVLRDGVSVGPVNHTLLIDKRGVEHPIDDSAAPIRNKDGKISGVVLVFRDITDRKQHERNVQNVLPYYEDIVAHLKNPLIILEYDQRIRAANHSFYREFRVTREDTEGRLLRDIGSGEWNDGELQRLLDQVFENNYPFEKFEYKKTFQEIGPRIILLSARRFPARKDRPTLVLLNIDDITDQKLADAAVVESELHYRRLFETAKDGILILKNESGRIMDANPFMSELLGYSHSQFLGKELWEIGLFQDVEENQSAYRALRENGYIRYENLPLKTKDSNQVDVEFVSNVYTAGQREVTQCNIRDITKRVDLERKNQEQAEALVDLHRRKDEFLAMLSHELRNPLAPILNALHLLQLDGGENPIQKQARAIIKRQVGQLARLVDDLLEVSRFTSGRVRLLLERFDFRSIIERAVESARPLIDNHKHKLSINMPSQPIWVNVDPTRIEQMIINLLTNAAKYTDAGGQIGIGVHVQGSEVVLIVRDTGIGISAEQIPHLFDLFSQGYRSLDRSQGGLGIGLSLVKRLAELHGGAVSAYSAGLGHGSEFTVTLPIADAMATPPLALTEAATVPSALSKKILVVDDNIDATVILEMLLTNEGYQVKTAFTGPTAIEVAKTFVPDAIILDIGLPEMDGFEVARRIRQEPNLAKVVLIAMSGYGQESDLELSRMAGFNNHLVKPMGFLKVRDLLAQRLNAAETETTLLTARLPATLEKSVEC